MKNYTVGVKKLHKDAVMPKYAYVGDAGCDLYTLEDVVIKANQTIAVPTGIALELPKNTEAQIRPRSGISLNGCKGCYKYIETNSHTIHDMDKMITTVEESSGTTITTLKNGKVDFKVNANQTISPYLRVQFGTVDSGFKNGLGIITYNQENYDVLVPKGTRLAQMVIKTASDIILDEVFELSDSDRGLGGFGSSGTN